MLASLILMSDLLGADELTPHMASAVWQIEHRDGEGAEEGQEPTQASLEIVSLIQRRHEQSVESTAGGASFSAHGIDVT
jgi:hypothetical protein